MWHKAAHYLLIINEVILPHILRVQRNICYLFFMLFYKNPIFLLSRKANSTSIDLWNNTPTFNLSCIWIFQYVFSILGIRTTCLERPCSAAIPYVVDLCDIFSIPIMFGEGFRELQITSWTIHMQHFMFYLCPLKG